MNSERAFVVGVVGAAVMSLIMMGVRLVGVPIDLELRLAALIGMHAWLAGFVLYLLIGGLLAQIYALGFEYILNQAGVGAGLLFGAIHGIAAGFTWAIIGGYGPFWDALGIEGLGLLFGLHFLYGAIVGGLYRTVHTLVEV